MILVLGGIRESRKTAEMLLDAGRNVLFCTATEMSFPLPDSERIERRTGELDREELDRLLRERPVRAVLDVTHPYAGRISKTAREACGPRDVPLYCYLRPSVLGKGADDVTAAADHEQAARLACEAGSAVLLTIGTRSLEPYVRRAREADCRLYVRTLPRPECRQACRALGLEDEQILSGGESRSVEENVSALRRCGADALVTKDSGKEGGAGAKQTAARRTDCRIIAVRRPRVYPDDVYDSVDSAVQDCLRTLRE